MINSELKLKSSIEKGTKYLYNLTDSDDGLLFHNEQSPCSGIWVTAEALEFLILSQNITREGKDLGKINAMVKFVVDSQNSDGSWNILKDSNETPSSISTGHCVYALKLALSKNYYCTDNPFEIIYRAIKRGEEWLINNCREENDEIYWKTGKKIANEKTTKNTDGLRIEHVFTTFYAMLGFVNVSEYLDNLRSKDYNEWTEELSEKNPKKIIISGVSNYLKSEAVYFYNCYRDKKLDSNVFSQIASTISRICGGLLYFNCKISSEVKTGLKKNYYQIFMMRIIPLHLKYIVIMFKIIHLHITITLLLI